MMLEVKLPGVKALERSRQNAAGKRFDSKENEENKKRIAHAFKEEAFKEGIKLPINPGLCGYRISIHAWYAIPQRTTQRERGLISRYSKLPQVKPDIDNVEKLWLDALVQGGIITDDKCVTALTGLKYYADGCEPATSCSIIWEEDHE